MFNYRRQLCSFAQAVRSAVTVIIITLLILPSFLIAAPPRAPRRNQPIAPPAAVSTASAPEPFVIGAPSGSGVAFVPVLAATLYASAKTLVSGWQMPPGLVMPNPPTFTDRLYSTIGSLVTLLPSAKPVTKTAPVTPVSITSYDFDGDGTADIGRWHAANSEFKVIGSTAGALTYSLGELSAKPTPGDFNGDGNMDAGVFDAGTWTYKVSTGASAATFSWGMTGDIPVTGDYDGDGNSDFAIWRPSTATWWINYSGGGYTSYALGASTDIPVPGDYDGDGLSDYAVFRPSNGTWYIEASRNGSMGAAWGASYDIPVQGDFDGDGMSDPTVYRPTTGTWYVLESNKDYTTNNSQVWGNYADQPTPADYDGDGTTDFSVWRPTTGQWFTLKSTGGDETHTLGVPGDTAIPSSYTKQVGGTATADVLAAARLSPRNATGDTDLYSQNFAWGTSLVSLPGRSGLNAGLGIGYNSLIWLKSGSAMYFNPDTSNAGPGFRFGLPVIEPIYWDGDKELWSYMMVSASGARTEFHETSVAGTFDTNDSSYTRLTKSDTSNPNAPVEGITITVKTKDGTQMSYEWLMGAYRCTKIKDRNGNHIDAGYDWAGHLTTLTDTLGRVVTIAYDSGTSYPTTITQTWKGSNGSGSNTTHTWATLSYTTKTVNTDFHSSITAIVGPPDDTVLTVLDKITYADGSFTKFEYNDYIQVKKVSNVAADSTSHVLNYVSTNLASPASSQTDCPRFTETKSWVENFNLSGGTPQEVVVTNTFTTGVSYSLPGSISGSATRVNLAMTGHPDALITKMYFGASGYKEGLPLATEDCLNDTCSGADRKRWTWTDWTQDDVYAAYRTNPRVVETRVGDGSNTKKTTIAYRYDTGTSSYLYGLPETIAVGDGTTVLKTQTTTYDLNSAYTSRRIIGLPAETKLWQGTTAGTLMSKVTYAYDEGNLTGSDPVQNISPTQHDNTNYSSSFVTGRGLLTSATRWNVEYPTSSGYAVTTSMKYNTAGAMVSKTDPLSRTVKIAYADNYNSTVGVDTYAYPTTLTDPAGNSSTIKYRYDIGANVEALSPAPAGNSYGKKSVRTYHDTYGRLVRDAVWQYVASSWAEQSYVRYEYPDNNGIQKQTFETLVNVDGDGDIAEDEVLTESWMDGAGRKRISRAPHPGSTGGWSGVFTEYDKIGRIVRQSVPTEIDIDDENDPNTWAPIGEDSARGLVYNYQYYDWKNRVVRTVPSDSTGSDGKDTLISYEGCGCAGGQVMTVEGPLVPRTDTTGNARRKQKAYEDILGRTWKTQGFLWNGTTPYLTTETTFNGRDQAVTIEATDEVETVTQVTSMTYDGHGRLATKHIPQQDAETETVYAYNADDTISSVTDARGAVTNYTYNSRRLVTNIGWTVPGGSGIADPADVTFSYDNMGNRTAMDDGLGSVEYNYDSLSRMTDETRYFDDTLTDAPLTGNGFKLEYTYTLRGQLKSLKDPYGQQTNYSHDKTGRVTSVTDSASFAGLSTYASGIGYRAWGAVKGFTYGNGSIQTQTFNNRLQTDHFELNKSDTTPVMDKDYEYNADGNLRFINDALDGQFDRLTTYDFGGRPKEAKSSTEANGTPITDPEDQKENLPYRQSYSFNAFGNMTQRNNLHYGADEHPITEMSFNLSFTYSNNRVTNTAWYYDADGRLLERTAPEAEGDYQYDAAGRISYSAIGQGDPPPNTTPSYDGDGRQARKYECSPVETNCTSSETKTYFIISSVLGATVTEYSIKNPMAYAPQRRYKSYVRVNGQVLAAQVQYLGSGTPTATIRFEHWDAADMSYKTSGPTETITGTFGLEGAPAEFDPVGEDAGVEYPYDNTPPTPTPTQYLLNRDHPLFRGGPQTLCYGRGQISNPWFPCSPLYGFWIPDRSEYSTNGFKFEIWGNPYAPRRKDPDNDRPIDTKPSATPRCTISMAAQGPQVGGEMDLAGGTDLGPVSLLGFGVRLQVEISARFVKTFPQTVLLNQSVTSKSTVWIHQRSAIKQNVRSEGDTNEERQYYDLKNGIAYTNDAPGLVQSPDATQGITGIFQGNFTSWYEERGVRLCSVDWHVSISALFGDIISIDFGVGHQQY